MEKVGLFGEPFIDSTLYCAAPGGGNISLSIITAFFIGTSFGSAGGDNGLLLPLLRSLPLLNPLPSSGLLLKRGGTRDGGVMCALDNSELNFAIEDILG